MDTDCIIQSYQRIKSNRFTRTHLKILKKDLRKVKSKLKTKQANKQRI